MTKEPNQNNDGGAEIVRLRRRVLDLEETLRSVLPAGDELYYCLRQGNRVSEATIKDAIRNWEAARNAK